MAEDEVKHVCVQVLRTCGIRPQILVCCFLMLLLLPWLVLALRETGGLS